MSEFGDTGAPDEGDFHMTSDIDGDWSTVGQQLALLEALYRRLRQKAKRLFYNFTYGTRVDDFLSAGLTQDRIISLIITECRKEEDVRDVFVDIDPTSGDYNIRVDSRFGDFAFTLAQKEATNGS